MNQLNGYIAILKGQRIEIRAESLWAAKQQAIAQLKPRKKDMGLLAVALAEKGGKPITHIAVD